MSRRSSSIPGEGIFSDLEVQVPLPAGTTEPAKSAAQGARRKAKPNGLQQVLKPTPQLAAVIGSGQISRGEVVSKIWTYIKKNNLHNQAGAREILADVKLKPVFGGKDKVTVFEMNKHLAKHLK